MSGLDRQTYFATVGTVLYDGTIVEINEQEVVFEQEVEDQFGIAVPLADEKALSQTRSPYRSIRSLAEYVARVVREAELNHK